MTRDLPPDRQTPGLARTLGVPQIVFMVVAMAAPLTVVAGLIPLMIATGNGTGAPLNFVVMGLVLVLFTVGFSAMTPEVADAGAFYSYVQKGLGRVIGLGAATLAIATYAVLLVSVAAYLGAAVHNVLVTLAAVSVPWWSLSGVCLLAIAFLGYRNIEMSARVLSALLVAEILIVAVLDLAIVVHGGDRGLSGEPFTWGAFSQGAVGTGIMYAIFGFVGFEATAVFRSEAKDPDTTVPRATYTAVLVIAVVYAVSAWAVIVGAGTGKVVALAASRPEALTPDLATRYVSTFAHDVMQCLLATSFFACVLTVHNVVSRYTFTLGRKGVLPASFEAVHPKHRSPHVASLVTSGIVSIALAVMAVCRLDPVVQIYAWFGGAGTLGLIFLLALTSIAIVAHFRRNPRGVSKWKGAIAPGIASASLLGTLFLVVGNFELLIGSSGIAWAFLAFLVLAYVAGLAWALRLRAARPKVYAGLVI
ncbi:APC family permease [Amycolatopsis echigonensis]|uniref:APC family permease n=1 Tax=Amycolatopsis echigonensis TaxID=2576905 RepID=A0A2N3X1E6_9PSEU|nr:MULTISPECIES: APC family permease [Amycolatopsis]MBB2504571.1 APC family permease [Amycolatopsis echigonensis]PKV99940.1 amino acid/polyamine/organocation transporter (APC superfamily) [Amycolatopsis niigatensis]